jgi:hypothetical protein
MRISVALTVGAIVLLGGVVYLAVIDPSPLTVLLATGGVLAAGFVVGAQVALSFSRRPRWRGAAAQGQPGWSELRRELDRSRRAGHELALIRVAPPRTGRWESRAIGPSTADATRSLLRSSDSLWIDGGALYVLLPECSSAGAGVALERLSATMPLAELRTSIASFPEGGWTSEVLLAKLHGYDSSGVAFKDADELERRQRIAQAARADEAHGPRTVPRTRRRQDREAS